MDWFFSGIGTAVLTFIFGLAAGGTAGYKIGIKKKTNIKQKQRAKDNASQVQVGRDYNGK